MVLQVLQDLQAQGWSAVCTREGCEVRKDRIVTPARSYLYIRYGLQNPPCFSFLETQRIKAEIGPSGQAGGCLCAKADNIKARSLFQGSGLAFVVSRYQYSLAPAGM